MAAAWQRPIKDLISNKWKSGAHQRETSQNTFLLMMTLLTTSYSSGGTSPPRIPRSTPSAHLQYFVNKKKNESEKQQAYRSEWGVRELPLKSSWCLSWSGPSPSSHFSLTLQCASTLLRIFFGLFSPLSDVKYKVGNEPVCSVCFIFQVKGFARVMGYFESLIVQRLRDAFSQTRSY